MRPRPVDLPEPNGAHPRPQRRRNWWRSLDGPWDFALEVKASWRDPSDVAWDRVIQVPFAPETEASGIHDTGYHEVCWYRRTIKTPTLDAGERLVLHFNAVDYDTRVWANDRLLIHHEGGYTPFMVDITEWARRERSLVVTVRAEDDPFDLAKPRGKQDWQLEPHSIWYPRTSGIWQTVWLERLPETSIDSVRWTPNLERWELSFECRLGGRPREDLRLRLELQALGRTLACDEYRILGGELVRRIALTDPGIDDSRNELLWSPQSPTLIDGIVELVDPEGAVIDRIETYTALRSIAVQGQTVVLNGRPYPLRLVLDQGYWPETGLTPPNSEALRRDVELTKEMGFNGVRKHQKVEDPRYYYWADRLGLLVWVEMPSAYRFTVQATERMTREWMRVIDRDYSHPCVIVWVPFNESWGVPNLPEVPAQRHLVQALYALTKTLDPTRLVIGNDGWESTATDIVGIHDYDDQPERLERRYHTHENMPNLFRRERPSGRLITLEGYSENNLPIVLTEFGGIAYSTQRDGYWGYSMAGSSDVLCERYTGLLDVVRTLPALAGFCYTQFTDTYQEANGLLYFDRTPKFALEQIADATRGPRVPRMAQVESVKRAERGAPGSQHDPVAP